MNQTRIGFIGCGEHANANLLPSLSHVEKAELVATCDIDKSKARTAAEVFGAKKCFMDYNQMLEEIELDAIIVAGPPQLHFAAAKKALKKGVGVFVEKPPTIFTEELKKLAELAKTKNIVTGVGHNVRYAKPYQTMEQIASDPSFGNAICMNISFLSAKPRAPLWGLKSVLRSFLLAQAIHPVDLLLSQMGLPQKVTANLHQDEQNAILLSVQLAFEDGKIGNLLTGSCASHFQMDLEIIGDQSKIVRLDSLWNLNYQGANIELENTLKVSKRWITTWSPSPLDTGYSRAGYLGELQEFIESIRTERQMRPNFKDEILVYETLDAIEKNVLTNKQEEKIHVH